MKPTFLLLPFLSLVPLQAEETTTLEPSPAVPVPAPAAPTPPAAPVADPVAPVDMAGRRQSVINLSRHIAMREERLNEIAADIRAVDERNEKRIDGLVDTLSNLKDSESTKTRVNALKDEAIDDLRKGISIYLVKRRDIFERLRSDRTVPVQALTGDMEKFDARIQKRVDQILELAKSMPARQNVEKYEDDGGVYWNGWYQETTRISEEWKQNRRQGVATEKSHREIREALDKAVDELESRLKATAERVKNPAISAEERAIQKEELGRIETTLATRKGEILELGKPEEPAEGTPDNQDGITSSGGKTTAGGATRDQVDETKDMLEDARRDISADFWSVLGKYTDAARERDKVIALKENLAAREKWLAEHDKPAP